MRLVTEKRALSNFEDWHLWKFNFLQIQILLKQVLPKRNIAIHFNLGSIPFSGYSEKIDKVRQ